MNIQATHIRYTRSRCRRHRHRAHPNWAINGAGRK